MKRINAASLKAMDDSAVIGVAYAVMSQECRRHHGASLEDLVDGGYLEQDTVDFCARLAVKHFTELYNKERLYEEAISEETARDGDIFRSVKYDTKVQHNTHYVLPEQVRRLLQLDAPVFTNVKISRGG